MVVTKIAKRLQSFGLSEYEARAYAAALALNLATPYELARQAEIPTSKIYEIVAKLKDRGLLHEIADDGKKKFVPEEWSEFLAREESAFAKEVGALKQELATLKKSDTVSFIYNLRDYEHLIEKSREMIERAKKTILLSAWPAEMAKISDLLNDALSRRVKIAIVHFGAPEISIGATFSHPIQDTLYSEKGGRGYTIVIDSSSALVGTVFPEQTVEGAWSVNRGFVVVAEDYIKHDIYVMKMVSRFDGQLIKTFGPNYKLMRDIFSDFDTKKSASK